jgi:hypothetical protein
MNCTRVSKKLAREMPETAHAGRTEVVTETSAAAASNNTVFLSPSSSSKKFAAGAPP